MFQTTIRCLSSHEISDDPALVARLKVLYDTLDTGTTPTTVLLPWLPLPSMIKKLLATKEIYDIIVNAINNREKSRVYRNDTLQMLLDSGDEKLVVIGVRRVSGSPFCRMLTLRSLVHHGPHNRRSPRDRHDRCEYIKKSYSEDRVLTERFSVLVNNVPRWTSRMARQGGGGSSVFARLPFAIRSQERNFAVPFRSIGERTPRSLGIGNARPGCHY